MTRRGGGKRLARKRRERKYDALRGTLILPDHPRKSLGLLQRELHGKSSDRWNVIARHARRNADRHVVRCTPGPEESQTHAPSIGKVVYDTQRKAQLCAQQLSEVTQRTYVQRAYPCGRGENGGEHWHLTTRPYLDGEVMNDD